MPKAGRSVMDYLLHLDEWIGKMQMVERDIAATNSSPNQVQELALARTLEVIGEISGRLIAEHPEWASDKRSLVLDDAYRLRNKLIHGNDGLDSRLLLEIARTDVPDMHRLVTGWISALDGRHGP